MGKVSRKVLAPGKFHGPRFREVFWEGSSQGQVTDGFWGGLRRGRFQIKFWKVLDFGYGPQSGELTKEQHHE